MKTSRLLLGGALVVVALVVFGAAAHASAGANHDGGACIACALCEWLNSLVA